jgi:cell volume regulation protein A
MADPLVVFGAIAGLMFLGFVGNIIFSKFKLNDTLLLILVGVILGPATGMLPVAAMAEISNIIGPLALILILFDGGLALKMRDLLGGLGSAATLGIIGFVITTAAVGGVVSFALGIPFISALILGAILGGTSALVVLPSLAQMNTNKKTATTLGLESALTDVLVVVVSFTLISIVALGDLPDAQSITSKLAITFAMSLFFGISAGFLWIWLLPSVRDKPFGYMLTLGVMFALYVITEWILQDVSSGGGPLAVLAFGVVLGNVSGSDNSLGKRLGHDFGEGMKKFQGEISFIVRTFFFVYLGALVDFAVLADLFIWALAIVLFVIMLIARYIAVVATTLSPKLQGDAKILLAMGPRGLAAAVLAAEPASRGIAGTESFVGLAFLILLFTNILSTAGAFVLDDGGLKIPEQRPKISARPTVSGAKSISKSGDANSRVDFKEKSRQEKLEMPKRKEKKPE